MQIGGLQKLTLIDFPGKISCTVFCLGCNFRCCYCYNPELVLPEKIKKQPRIPEKDFFDFLKERKKILEGVCIGGGEPTINEDLPNFAWKIKTMGYSVKLDTNGSKPEMLKKIIDRNLVDYVAMDIKAPLEKYSEVVNRKIEIKDIEESVEFLKQGKVDCEFRTTMVPGLVEEKDVIKIARWLGPIPKYNLQNFRAGKTIDPKFEKVKPYSEEYITKIYEKIHSLLS